MLHSSATSARMIWSESIKITLRSDRGNSTSRNRILYAQMMRCFSVCRQCSAPHRVFSTLKQRVHRLLRHRINDTDRHKSEGIV